MRWVSARARRGSPGFGVSFRSSARWRATASGGVIPYRARTARASASVVGSGTVGPEPMVAGSSPGTSEMSSVTTRAGQAAAASRPPLMALRCLRTQFISSIEAPEARSARFTACFSARLRPSPGRVSSADAPPEISATTRSSSVRPSTLSRMRRAASLPRSSGTGCAASTISMRLQGAAWPYRVTTSPVRSPFQFSSNARAIAADALPAPTTIVRPLGGSGRWRGTIFAGSASPIAASKRRRRKVRAKASSMSVSPRGAAYDEAAPIS